MVYGPGFPNGSKAVLVQPIVLGQAVLISAWTHELPIVQTFGPLNGTL